MHFRPHTNLIKVLRIDFKKKVRTTHSCIGIIVPSFQLLYYLKCQLFAKFSAEYTKQVKHFLSQFYLMYLGKREWCFSRIPSVKYIWKSLEAVVGRYATGVEGRGTQVVVPNTAWMGICIVPIDLKLGDRDTRFLSWLKDVRQKIIVLEFKSLKNCSDVQVLIEIIEINVKFLLQFLKG